MTVDNDDGTTTFVSSEGVDLAIDNNGEPLSNSNFNSSSWTTQNDDSQPPFAHIIQRGTSH